MIGRLGGLVLLVLGAASGWFALLGDYTVLMNPAFRWVTLAGAVLLLAMGALQIGSRQGGSLSALLVFGGLFGIVAWAQPQAGGVAPGLRAPEGMPSLEREGYAPFACRALFENLDEEARLVAPGPVVMRGFVKRLPELDATGEFVLLESQMACCLADVLALGIRVRSPDGALPEDGAWIHAFGELAMLSTPIRTPSFRVGAILFIAVSRLHRLQALEVVGYRALLEDLYDKVPSARCARFCQRVEEAGLVETLRSDGPFTVFVPLDAAFERLPTGARVFLGDLIVRGRYTRQELYAVNSLQTLRGTTLQVRNVNGKLLIGGARIIFGDQEARNGMLHLVHPLPAPDPSGR